MSSEHLVVKVGHEGCIWRLKVPVQDVSYNKVKEVVGKTVSLEKGRVIRYKDDEGDMCVLTSETFDDAMDISLRDNGLLRLDVVNAREPLPASMLSHAEAMYYHTPLSSTKPPSTDSVNLRSPQLSIAESSGHDKIPVSSISRASDSVEHPSEVSPAAPFRSGHSTPRPSGAATTVPIGCGMETTEGAPTPRGAVAQLLPSKLNDRIYAPKPVLRTFLCLNEMNMLTPRMITSVTVSFIPLMIQRCSRHTDRLSYHVHKKYDCIRPTLQSMLLAITHIPELHEFMPLLQAIVNSGPNTPEVTEFGQWFVGLLKSFSTLSFDTQVQVLLMVAPSWIPCFRTAIQLGRFDVPPTPKQQVTHYGVECDGCGVNPIVGPRFKCQVCDYDLCGECYPNKSTIHAESHDFVCVLRSGREASGVKLGLLTKESPSSKLSAPTMLSAKASSLKCRTPAGEEEHRNYHWATNG